MIKEFIPDGDSDLQMETGRTVPLDNSSTDLSIKWISSQCMKISVISVKFALKNSRDCIARFGSNVLHNFTSISRVVTIKNLP